jgi:single-stranded DNA-binding protein
MEGNNFVEFVGFMRFPELRETGTGKQLFKGKVAIPFEYKDRQTGEVKNGSRYYKISAWGELAEELSGVVDGAPIKVQGIYNERTYDGNCKHCGVAEKKYYTDVLVNNFVLMEE